MPGVKFYLALFLGTTLLLVNSCGGTVNDCIANSIAVSPASATVNHGALPPANGQAFTATTNPCGTAKAAAAVNANWAVSDPSVHLSPSPNATVIATCTAALANPVTITATAVDGMASAQASLTCN